MNHPHRIAIFALACVFCSAVTADEVIVRSGDKGAELPYKNVTVSMLKDGVLYWASSSRTESHKELSSINRIDIPGETDLNKAETNFRLAVLAEFAKDPKTAKQKYTASIPDYQAAMKSAKPLVKQVAASRLKVLASKSDRFDLALEVWIPEVTLNPDAAAKNKPSPIGLDPKSKLLSDGVAKLQGLAKSTSNAAYQRLYYGMVSDIQRAQGDTEGELKTLELIVNLGGNPEEIAQLQIKLGMVDLDKKSYDDAMEHVRKAGSLDSLPESSRADAYFMIAECNRAKAGASASPEALKDAAIDYMRVVAGFPGSPHAAQSLLRVAELLEAMKEPDTALKTYQSVAREYPNTPAAQAAKQQADRLARATPK